MTTAIDILTSIHQLDDNSLREVIEGAIGIHKKRLAEQHAKQTALFRTEQIVRFIGQNSHRLPHGAEGRVIKINTRSVTVDFGAFGRWRISASLLVP